MNTEGPIVFLVVAGKCKLYKQKYHAGTGLRSGVTGRMIAALLEYKS